MDRVEYCRPVGFVVTQKLHNSDFDEQSAVVRARSATEACLMAIAGQTDLDGVSDFPDTDTIEDCELSVERAPAWDNLEFSKQAAFKMGWWFSCEDCSRRVRDGDEDEDDDGNVLVPYLDSKDGVYCSRQCAGVEDEEES